jgi:hypothetical protein
MKKIADYLPDGQEMNDGGLGDFTDMIHRDDAVDAVSDIVNDLFDEVLGMYAEDGNPTTWRDKILILKESTKLQLLNLK